MLGAPVACGTRIIDAAVTAVATTLVKSYSRTYSQKTTACQLAKVPPATVVSAETAHKTFGPTVLTNTYSVCTRRVFGGIEPSGLESDALITRLSTAVYNAALQ
ncbi:hypothetical protein TNCV_2852621 [Trichonephila clavipes]|uniref:Uncharacterized protein n=1 Tax=Trichonephila clavipes TaxID=2585209 RepID=A0A8X6RGA9_TRICX|nr:hypothetical protein TNCV_2852621 [Trichonephila clavipes]